MNLSDSLIRRLEQIECLLLDVDGVLTDGSIAFTQNGEEIKRFHVRDGLGIRILMNFGIHVGIITGRSSGALQHRCKELGIVFIFEGSRNKLDAMNEIVRQTGVKPEQMAFIGDDLPDLSIMKRVGMSFAVANADPNIIRIADGITTLPGGQGAVREVCDMILSAKGFQEKIMEQFG